MPRLFLALLLAGVAAVPGPAAGDPAEEAFLVQLRRLDPPGRLRELAGWDQWQAERGGGFLGLLPGFSTAADSIPVPGSGTSVPESVDFLVGIRRANLEAILRIAPHYPLRHAGRSLPAWSSVAPEGWSLTMDLSVPRAFLDALEDGAVDPREAEHVAGLEANLQMLRHRDGLTYLPPPHPDAADVAELMLRVASDDPLCRIWAWLNPWNGFGYADLVENAEAYDRQLRELEARGDGLCAEALRRISALVPEDVAFRDRFALTVGWGIRGWATPAMSGLNLEQVKDDWDLMLGTLTEETFHRLQLEIVPMADGGVAETFEDLAVADTGNEGLDRLYEILAYTVLEGSANLARGDLAPERVRQGGPEGARLLERFVEEVVVDGDLEAADGLIDQGLRNNGPLYALGLEMARRIAAREGPRAVGAHLRRGPVDFARAALADGPPLLEPAVRRALDELRDRLPDRP